MKISGHWSRGKVEFATSKLLVKKNKILSIFSSEETGIWYFYYNPQTWSELYICMRGAASRLRNFLC